MHLFKRVKKLILRFLIFVMRIMTRHAGVVSRPIVKWYADKEIIACGYRTMRGAVGVIYSLVKQRENYYIVVKKGLWWEKCISISGENFSGNGVKVKLVPEIENHKIIQVHAHDLNTKNIVKSPKITVKDKTVYDTNLLKITAENVSCIHFSWESAEQYDPLLYFLTVADSNNKTWIAIYTRETSWSFPKFKTASLTIGPHDGDTLEQGSRYVAKLIVVDYDGWVPLISERSFSLG